MNKIITILSLLFLSSFSFAQITTTKAVEKKEVISTEPYDSIQNFLGKDVYKYIGQEFYLVGLSKRFRKDGYDNLIIDYKKDNILENKSNIYKCCDNYYSKYDELVGKYFSVIAVHKDPKAEENPVLYGEQYYIELKEKKSGDKIYYRYDTRFDFNFPFIVVGFFEKQKKELLGDFFVFANNILENSIDYDTFSNIPTTDIETGLLITNTLGEKWECIDLTIEQRNYELALVLKNAEGEKTMVNYNFIFFEDNFNKVYKLSEAKTNEKRFGRTNWLKILEGKILIGFTEEMVLLSWGKPKKINRASYGDQWVYEEQYLYFENGKLKSFN